MRSDDLVKVGRRAALGGGVLVCAILWMGLLHPALAAAKVGASDPFSGGASNLKQLWSDWSVPVFAVVAGAISIHHFGSRDYGKLAVLLLAGAVVGWVIGNPAGHLTTLGNDVGGLLGLHG